MYYILNKASSICEGIEINKTFAMYFELNYFVGLIRISSNPRWWSTA